MTSQTDTPPPGRLAWAMTWATIALFAVSMLMLLMWWAGGPAPVWPIYAGATLIGVIGLMLLAALVMRRPPPFPVFRRFAAAVTGWAVVWWATWEPHPGGREPVWLVLVYVAGIIVAGVAIAEGFWWWRRLLARRRQG